MATSPSESSLPSASKNAVGEGARCNAALSEFRPSVMHVCYYIADVERALSFYVGLLGMKEQLRIVVGNGLHEVILGFEGSKGSGVILTWDPGRTEPYRHGNAYSRLILRVSDVDAATRILGEHGVPILTQPTDAAGLRYSIVRDPDGYFVELLELKKG